jgi:hypothetical protein
MIFFGVFVRATALPIRRALCKYRPIETPLTGENFTRTFFGRSVAPEGLVRWCSCSETLTRSFQPPFRWG